MAKGKRTVALFEVISKDKRMERRPLAGQKPDEGFSRNLAAQAVDLWRRKRADPETLTGPAPTPVRKREAVFIPRLKGAWNGWTTRAGVIAASARTWMDRQLGALIGGGAAVLVICGMLLARHLSNRHGGDLSIEQALRDGPAHPAVLVGPAENSDEKPAGADASDSPELAADVIQAKGAAAAEPVAKPGARIVNLHYVLIQSYPEERMAVEARDFLNLNGVPCTIERGVKGWRMDFYQVIGLRGFAHIHGKDYADYLALIKSVGSHFAPGVRSYKRFEPEAIKW
jgi:hypothetical protein